MRSSTAKPAEPNSWFISDEVKQVIKDMPVALRQHCVRSLAEASAANRRALTDGEAIPIIKSAVVARKATNARRQAGPAFADGSAVGHSGSAEPQLAALRRPPTTLYYTPNTHY